MPFEHFGAHAEHDALEARQVARLALSEAELRDTVWPALPKSSSTRRPSAPSPQQSPAPPGERTGLRVEPVDAPADEFAFRIAGPDGGFRP